MRFLAITLAILLSSTLTAGEKDLTPAQIKAMEKIIGQLKAPELPKIGYRKVARDSISMVIVNHEKRDTRLIVITKEWLPGCDGLLFVAKDGKAEEMKLHATEVGLEVLDDYGDNVVYAVPRKDAWEKTKDMYYHESVKFFQCVTKRSAED